MSDIGPATTFPFQCQFLYIPHKIPKKMVYSVIFTRYRHASICTFLLMKWYILDGIGIWLINPMLPLHPSIHHFNQCHSSESVTNPIWIWCTQILDPLYPLWAQYFDNRIIKWRVSNCFIDTNLVKIVNRTYIST